MSTRDFRFVGWPTLNRLDAERYHEMPAEVTEVSAMIYIMNKGHPAPPSVGYLDTIERGYQAVGFHLLCLVEGGRRTQRQKAKRGQI